jgi:hypothetical protein
MILASLTGVHCRHRGKSRRFYKLQSGFLFVWKRANANPRKLQPVLPSLLDYVMAVPQTQWNYNIHICYDICNYIMSQRIQPVSPKSADPVIVMSVAMYFLCSCPCSLGTSKSSDCKISRSFGKRNNI